MKTNNRKEDGLPEIAQEAYKKNPLVFILIGVILVVFMVMFCFGKSSKKEAPSVEETYTLQAKNTNESQKLPQVNQEVVPQPSEERTKQITEEQLAIIHAKQVELQQRLSAPLMLVNNVQTKTEPTAKTDPTASDDHNTQFLNQAASQNSQMTMAQKIGPLNLVIAEGSFIHAILESANNSDLPGFVRAIVNEPCYSEDGSQVLIPRGSRLIGQYKSGMLQGQSRIFMVWTRLITPSGISIQLGSPGVDNLGMAGMGADEINRHFWQRFGTASLLSIIGAGTANVGVSGGDQDNSASAYRTAVANSFSHSANQSLEQEGKIAPTLMTYQGKPIMVFVARDLNFQEAMKQVKANLNVF